MEVFLLLVVLVTVLFSVAVGLAGLAQAKERQAKLELMKQHPQHAAQIQEAINKQDAHFQSQMKSVWKTEPVKEKGGGIGKIVVLVLCAAYIICPIDIIPDFIPVLGWGDDLAAGIIGLRALIK